MTATGGTLGARRRDLTRDPESLMHDLRIRRAVRGWFRGAILLVFRVIACHCPAPVGVVLALERARCGLLPARP